MTCNRNKTGVTINDRFDNNRGSSPGNLFRNFQNPGYRKRIIAILISAALLCGLSYLYFSEKEYVPLFDTPLPAAEAAQITSSLSALGIDYSVVSSGKMILVPRKSKNKALMQLSTQHSQTTEPQSNQGPGCREKLSPCDDAANDGGSPLERELQKKSQKILDAALGQDRAKVAVNARLDASTSEVETYKTGYTGNDLGQIPASDQCPNGGQPPCQGQVKEKERSQQEYYVNVPGKEGEDHTMSYRGSNDGFTEYERSDNTVVYKVDQMKKREINTPGRVDRITASVAVDDLSPEEIEKVNAIVKNAIGADEARGDSVTVVSLESAKESEGNEETKESLMPGGDEKSTGEKGTKGYESANAEKAFCIRVITAALIVSLVISLVILLRPAHAGKYERYRAYSRM